MGIVDLHILYPVKGVVAHQLEAPKHHIPAVHGEIVAFCRHMVKLHILAVPEGFSRIGKVYILQVYTPAATEILGSLNHRILYRNMICIPYACTGHLKPGTVSCRDIFGIPEGILPFKHAVLQLNVMALFQRRFPICKDAVIDFQIRPLKQRSFSCQILLSDFSCLHDFFLLKFLNTILCVLFLILLFFPELYDKDTGHR